MSVVIGALLAAVAALVVYNDARKLAARGVRVGDRGPGFWFWLSFLLLIVGGPLYLIMRPKALRGGGTGYRRGVRLPPPGWHPDPDDPQLLRWWDGKEWTDHTSIANLPPPPEQ
jgi:hypothetical protein